jgi:chorismate dehydratase
MALRIGCVRYLNARPLIHGWPGEVVLDHPAALCAQIARGELDVALVSSFEFLRNPIYRIVDGISISSAGPVYSVVVAHRGEISQVEEIELDPGAETSVNLLRCVLAERRLKPRLVERGAPATLGLAEARPSRAQLLIGDQAIRFRQKHREYRFWDLGEEWKQIVDLPFVFALWLIRPEFGDAGTVADLLRTARDKNFANLDKLIAEEKEFDAAFCRRYYRDNLHFSFADGEKAGLREFYKRCVELKLVPAERLELGAWDLELSRRCI